MTTNMGETIKKYRQLKEKKRAIDRLCKQKVALIDEEMGKLSREMLVFLEETGQKAAKTEFGKSTRTIKYRFSMTDPHLFYKHLLETGEVGLLNKALNTKTLQTYLEKEEDGTLKKDENGNVIRFQVPGVTVESRYEISVTQK